MTSSLWRHWIDVTSLSHDVIVNWDTMTSSCTLQFSDVIVGWDTMTSSYTLQYIDCRWVIALNLSLWWNVVVVQTITVTWRRLVGDVIETWIRTFVTGREKQDVSEMKRKVVYNSWDRDTINSCHLASDNHEAISCSRNFQEIWQISH